MSLYISETALRLNPYTPNAQIMLWDGLRLQYAEGAAVAYKGLESKDVRGRPYRRWLVCNMSQTMYMVRRSTDAVFFAIERGRIRHISISQS